MAITGGCYCGAVRYEADGPVGFRGQCTCRECTTITGGAENLFMVLPESGFRYVQGEPARFSRPDLPTPATREFCAACGTHLTTRAPQAAGNVILKVGSLDDPSQYGGPQAALWTSEAQSYHLIPEGVTAFPGFISR
jgi:hypothetical protein